MGQRVAARVVAARSSTISSTTGIVTHAAITRLLLTDHRAPDGAAIRDAVEAECEMRRIPLRDRRSIENRSSTLVATYFGHYLPPGAWALVHANAAVGRCRPDVVWSTSAHEFLFDEIKTSLSPLGPRLRQQMTAQLRDGCQEFGRDFTGIRLLNLANPSASQFVGADGDAVPLALTKYAGTLDRRRWT